MKHKFTIIYETDGLPICPDAIHKQLDDYLINFRKEFGKKYYKLPGLHKISLEPCGEWFAGEQKPMRFTVKISEIMNHPTKRMDAQYWIRKKNVQSDTKRKIQREEDRSKRSSKSDV